MTVWNRINHDCETWRRKNWTSLNADNAVKLDEILLSVIKKLLHCSSSETRQSPNYTSRSVSLIKSFAQFINNFTTDTTKKLFWLQWRRRVFEWEKNHNKLDKYEKNFGFWWLWENFFWPFPMLNCVKMMSRCHSKAFDSSRWALETGVWSAKAEIYRQIHTISGGIKQENIDVRGEEKIQEK